MGRKIFASELWGSAEWAEVFYANYFSALTTLELDVQLSQVAERHGAGDVGIRSKTVLLQMS
jgi:hypothetical protein